MCGFSGIYALDHKFNIDLHVLGEMTHKIRHRGPDDEGYLLLNTHGHSISHYSGNDSSPAIKQKYQALPEVSIANLGMGFRRLSIIDLSPAGHQPMSLDSQDLHIVFNGEIYNYQELRADLQSQGYSFHTATDTEVILVAYQAWGNDCVKRFIGMWAFAIWNGLTKQLFCSRDRFGIKPFYYLLQNNVLYFASEIKQLTPILASSELNNTMIRRSMKINALLVYGNETFWQDIVTLSPGHNIVVANGELTVSCFYTLDHSTFETYQGDFTSAVKAYQELFMDSIRLQMRSDVEVGSCLSGGMDSSAIVCAALPHTSQQFQTFSSYYDYDPALDERKWIRHIVEQTGCQSHLVSPTADEAIAWFEQVTYMNDLPTGAGYASQYAVMQSASEHGVKVLLDGQGSDELTAGYKHSNYRYFADMLRGLKLGQFGQEFPELLKSQKLRSVFPTISKIALSTLLPESMLYNLEFKYYRFEPFNQDFINSCETHSLSQITDLDTSRLSNFLFNMMNVTSIQTLLHYEDRMSMTHSVESRVPFLDHRLVEFAFSLPSHFKIKPPLNKYIHRIAMKNIVPKAIYDRKDKAIFSSPFYSTWMRGSFKPLVESTINSHAFRERGIWNLPMIHQKWQAYLAGKDRDAEMLFNVIAMETWFNKFVS